MIIVFDELELIIFVSQGLTLSTASLVLFKALIRKFGLVTSDLILIQIHVPLSASESSVKFWTDRGEGIPITKNSSQTLTMLVPAWVRCGHGQEIYGQSPQFLF